MTALPPIAIIAGNGKLPLEIAAALTTKAQGVFVFAIKDEANADFQDYPNVVLEWGQIGRLFKMLKAEKIKKVVLAGGIVGRPEFTVTKMDWGTMRTLPGLLSAMLGGDNAILTGVISVFEKRGFEVCNIAKLLPDMVASVGAITALKPKTNELYRIEEGARVTRALGQFDVGQACVLVGKRAVALEGVEGTAAMLARVAHLREIGRLPNKKSGVLVKAIKHGQDERADLPTIGPDTIEQVHAAGLVGIGVEASKTLIIEREATLKRAKELGIFIFGFKGDIDGR